jgi:hypothetical protein
MLSGKQEKESLYNVMDYTLACARCPRGLSMADQAVN